MRLGMRMAAIDHANVHRIWYNQTTLYGKPATLTTTIYAQMWKL